MFMENQNPINCELVIKRLNIVIFRDCGGGGGEEEEEEDVKKKE
jgi:hypothetical protein